MTPEEKYRDLERRALAMLRRPFDVQGFVHFARPALRLLVWRYPAFEPYQSWSLIEEQSHEDVRVLRRVTWNRAADYGRAANPVHQAGFMIERVPSPTVDVIDRRVSATFVGGMLDSINTLGTPSGQGRPGVVIDGVTNGVAIDDRDIELEWWCEGPPDWHRFTEGIEVIRERLEAAVAG